MPPLTTPSLVVIVLLTVKTRSKASGDKVEKEALPPLVVMAPLIVIAPVFVTLTLPVLDCDMPVTVKVLGSDVLTNVTLPVPLFVALKPVIVLVLLNTVPPTDDVVKVAPLMTPAPASLIAPAVPVKLILPVVLIVPALINSLRPAVKLMVPEPLLTFAFTLTSLVTPLLLKLTLPAPAADVTPLIVKPPVLLTTILPPPV